MLECQLGRSDRWRIRATAAVAIRRREHIHIEALPRSVRVTDTPPPRSIISTASSSPSAATAPPSGDRRTKPQQLAGEGGGGGESSKPERQANVAVMPAVAYDSYGRGLVL